MTVETEFEHTLRSGEKITVSAETLGETLKLGFTTPMSEDPCLLMSRIHQEFARIVDDAWLLLNDREQRLREENRREGIAGDREAS